MDYNYTTKENFLKMVDEGAFVEHAHFGSNRYGTSIQAVKNVADQGRTCILDIEMEVRLQYISKAGLCSKFDRISDRV